MKIKLSIIERMTIPNLIPDEGKVVYGKARTKVLAEIGLEDKEIIDCEIVQADKGITFNPQKMQKHKEREFEIGEIITEKIKESLKKLEDESKITSQYLSLYDKFVENAKEK